MNVLSLFMHEFDACNRGEWKMLKFLRALKDETQYLLFLYIHVPLTLGAFYYLWSVLESRNFLLWNIVNIFMIFHLILHLLALRWKTNVFRNVHSFLFISVGAVTGILNLCLSGYY
jgi:hypothetical protein